MEGDGNPPKPNLEGGKTGGCTIPCSSAQKRWKYSEYGTQSPLHAQTGKVVDDGYISHAVSTDTADMLVVLMLCCVHFRYPYLNLKLYPGY
jgi:hypothetical protein